MTKIGDMSKAEIERFSKLMFDKIHKQNMRIIKLEHEILRLKREYESKRRNINKQI